MNKNKLPLLSVALVIAALLLGIVTCATMSPGIAGDGSLAGVVEGAIDGAEGIIGGAVDRFDGENDSSASSTDSDTDTNQVSDDTGADSGSDSELGITPEEGTDSDAADDNTLRPGDASDSGSDSSDGAGTQKPSTAPSDTAGTNSGEPTEYAGIGFWGIVIIIAVVAAIVLMIFAFIPKH